MSRTIQSLVVLASVTTTVLMGTRSSFGIELLVIVSPDGSVLTRTSSGIPTDLRRSDVDPALLGQYFVQTVADMKNSASLLSQSGQRNMAISGSYPGYTRTQLQTAGQYYYIASSYQAAALSVLGRLHEADSPAEASAILADVCEYQDLAKQFADIGLQFSLKSQQDKQAVEMARKARAEVDFMEELVFSHGMLFIICIL